MKRMIEIFNNSCDYNIHITKDNELLLFNYSCENYYKKVLYIILRLLLLHNQF